MFCFICQKVEYRSGMTPSLFSKLALFFSKIYHSRTPTLTDSIFAGPKDMFNVSSVGRHAKEAYEQTIEAYPSLKACTCWEETGLMRFLVGNMGRINFEDEVWDYDFWYVCTFLLGWGRVISRFLQVVLHISRGLTGIATYSHQHDRFTGWVSSWLGLGSKTSACA